MPKGNKNLIESLWRAHDPHFKLEGRVEELEKKLPIQLADLHKTLSKSFGMQRKTLIRVLELEKKIAELQAAKEKIEEVVDDIGEDKIEEVVDDIKDEPTPSEPEEPEEEIPEGLDDILDDIRDEPTGTPGVSTKIDPPKTTPKKKKKRPRIKIRKSKIRAADIKKGTPLDEGYASRVMGLDEKGEYLSKEERIRRFKGGALAKPDELKPDVAEPAAAEVDSEKSQEGLLPILKSISSSVDGIKETLIGQAEVSKDQTEFLRKQQENKKRNKRESGLE